MNKTQEAVWKKRIFRNGEIGPSAVYARVAKALAKNETGSWEHIFYHDMKEGKWLPGSPFLVNAGASNTLFSCFVIPVDDSLDGIFNALKYCAKIQACYGGVGFSVNNIRPRGDSIKGSPNSKSSGPVGFMPMFDQVTNSIKQGNRDGALMCSLRVDHPDIEEFIDCKQGTETFLTNMNISVCITDKFMEAVEKGVSFNLVHSGKVYKTVDAGRLWNKIATNSHNNGSPGVLFIDTINQANPTPELGEIETTNPCVTADTWLMTANGYERVGDLFEKKEILWVTVDERTIKEKKHTYHTTPVFQTSDSEPIYRVTLDNGMFLKCTKTHDFFVQDSKTKEIVKKSLKDIDRKRDAVLIYQRTENRSSSGLGHKGFSRDIGNGHLGYFLGMLYGNPRTFFLEDKDGTECIMVRNEKEDTSKDERVFRRRMLRELVKLDGKLPIPSGAEIINERALQYKKIFKFRKLTEYFKNELGVCFDNRNQVPQIIMNGTWECFKAFVQSMFWYRGSFEDKTLLVTIEHESEEFVQCLQMRLNSAGITSDVTCGKSKYKGDNNVFKATPKVYKLTIRPESMYIYIKMIWFHNGKELELLLEPQRKRFTSLFFKGQQNHFVSKIAKITKLGNEPTYCLTQKNGNTVVFNGIVTGNCGESPLLPFESCCLGSINLARQSGIADLENSVQHLVRFLDNAFDVNVYPLPEIEEQTKKTRKIGLGVMGFADYLIGLGIRYGSENSFKEADGLMCSIHKFAVAASRAIACEKGLDYPRNATLTSIAPTGSISILAGCSSGLEPIFSLVQKRNILGGEEFYEVHPMFENELKRRGLYSTEILDKIAENGSIQNMLELPEDLRHVYVVASDIEPDAHITMQSVFQKHTDLAVSKTINLGHEATVEDISNAFQRAYDLGCKGSTAYRDGSRVKQVLEKKSDKSELHTGGIVTGPTIYPDEKNIFQGGIVGGITFHRDEDFVTTTGTFKVEEPMAKRIYPGGFNYAVVTHEKTLSKAEKLVEGIGLDPSFYREGIDAGVIKKEELIGIVSEVNSGGTLMVADEPMGRRIMDKKVTRPATLQGITTKVRSEQGPFYITVNGNKNGPTEIFSSPHYKSKDAVVNAEALCRIVSMSLRYGTPVERIISQFKKVRGQSMLSLPNCIAKGLQEFVDNKDRIFPEEKIGVCQSPFTAKVIDPCPDCGKQLYTDGGCVTCKECGWSKCG